MHKNWLVKSCLLKFKQNQQNDGITESLAVWCKHIALLGIITCARRTLHYQACLLTKCKCEHMHESEKERKKMSTHKTLSKGMNIVA